MDKLITGIHHVTAIAGNAQENLNFYKGVLGLRLVKKTVNFDAPEVYHFYYGDETGNPGSILTFFPYQGLVRGRQGKGMVNTTTFSVDLKAIDFWTKRFKKYNVPYKEATERFEGEVVIYFEDLDGLGLELVFNNRDGRTAFSNGIIPPEFAIKGFYNVEIWLEGYEKTAGILQQQLNHELIAEKENRFRFAATDSPGNYIDLLCMPDSLKGLSGSGTIHHIAFATPDQESQQDIRINLLKRMVNPTPVLDRNYFTSVYFREPGGVLFEVATSGPGFTIDEPADRLGELLKLPDQYERQRSAIEKVLPPIFFNPENFR